MSFGLLLICISLFAGMTPELANTIRAFRRPQTGDSINYWFMSEEKWNETIEKIKDASNSEGRKALRVYLRKYDIAGRICEVPDAGRPASMSCKKCKDTSRICRVPICGGCCAYCTCKGIPHRNAKPNVQKKETKGKRKAESSGQKERERRRWRERRK